MSRMKDLLGDEPFDPKSPHQLTRTTYPRTSFQAAAAMVPRLRPIQKIVLEHLRFAGARGMPDRVRRPFSVSVDAGDLCANRGRVRRSVDVVQTNGRPRQALLLRCFQKAPRWRPNGGDR